MQIASEMRTIEDYNKSVILCQTFVTLVYVVIGSVVYHFTGQYIASPALGSAGPLLKRASPLPLTKESVSVSLTARSVMVLPSLVYSSAA